MRLLVVAALCVALSPTLALTQEADEAVPCDDGLAHIPNTPNGGRRPYSVRKRSKTVHREAAVTDDTPQLPPGRRRFDEVLPDEGSDVKASPPVRAQRRLDLASQETQPSEKPVSRRTRRPAYPKKVITPREPQQGENYPPDHPAFRGGDPKKDAVVDSYEAVRKYPTHQEQQEDEDLQDNDLIAGERLIDQIAVENVSEERLDNAVEPRRASGDVLRLKPRKKANSYRAPPAEHTAEHIAVHTARPRPAAEEELLELSEPPRRDPGHTRRRPSYQPEAPISAVSERHQESESTAAPAQARAQAYRGRQRYRASHRVGGQPSQAQFRRVQVQRAPLQQAEEDPQEQVIPVHVQEEQLPQNQPQNQPQLRRRVPAVRRRPVTEAPRRTENEILDNSVSVDPEVVTRYPSRRRQRIEQDQVQQVQQETVPPPAPVPGYRRRVLSQRPALHAEVLFAKDVATVEVEHDGSAKPSLVRSNLKAASHPDHTDPALIQKIVKNTLKRLHPQIAERDGDVGVDILVKIIQLDD